MNLIAVAEIVIVILYLIDAVRPGRQPVQRDRLRVEVRQLRTRWSRSASLALLAVWWSASAKHWFTGPKNTIDEAVVKAFDD